MDSRTFVKCSPSSAASTKRSRNAFGICAALHVDGQIETSCPDSAEPLSIAVRGQRPDDERLVFHCLVPAARWWDDIVFT
jgi:hypothetical protein